MIIPSTLIFIYTTYVLYIYTYILQLEKKYLAQCAHVVVDIYICSDSLYTPSGNMLHIYQELNGPRLPYQTEDSPLIHFDPL